MKRSVNFCLLILVIAPLDAAWSTDACATLSVHTKAQVTVSDGSEFHTEAWYQSPDAAAIRHMDINDRMIAVEGPFSWVRRGEAEQTGTAFHARFALGHQFHAMLLEFAVIAKNPREVPTLTIRGVSYRAISGDNPRGGLLHLLEGDDVMRPAGLAIESPESTPILVTYHDWRDDGERSLPYNIRIDDGERVFDYRFSSIRVSDESPLWFFEVVPPPSTNQVQIYRLHRRLLAAHCLGDARMMSDLAAPETIVVSRGRLFREPRESVQDQFSNLFQRVDYIGYHDLAWPIIEVAESGDLGWAAVNVRATGIEQNTGRPFDDQWAWIMTVAKIDGRWLYVGNAANRSR